jgi:hypothetical protein
MEFSSLDHHTERRRDPPQNATVAESREHRGIIALVTEPGQFVGPMSNPEAR